MRKLLSLVLLIPALVFAGTAKVEVDTKTHAVVIEDGSSAIDAKTITLTLGGFTISDASGVKTIHLGTTSGTKIGGAGEKIGFLDAVPIVRPSATTDLRQALINLGLYTTGGASPLNLNGGAFTSGPITATTGAFSGNETIGGTLGVTGAVTGSSLTLSGNGSVNTLSVTGASTLHAITGTTETLSGTLAVTGNTTFGGTVGITGATTASSLALSGNETVGGTLGITGATSGAAFSFTGNGTVGGTLGITGLTSGAGFAFTGNGTVGGTLGVTGPSTFAAISGTNETLSGNLSIGGNVGFYGTSPIAKPTGNLFSSLTSLGLVGSPTLAESDITSLTGDLSTINSTITANDAAALHKTGNETASGNKTLSGNTSIGGTLGVTGAVSGSSFSFSGNGTVTGTLLPGFIDMGTTQGANKFDFYHSGTTHYSLGILNAELRFSIEPASVFTFGQQASDGTFTEWARVSPSALNTHHVYADDVLIGIADATPELVFYGDSITAGNGNGPYNQWMNGTDAPQIQGWNGLNFHQDNVAINGATINYLLEANSVVGAVFRRQAGLNIVVLMAGTNNFSSDDPTGYTYNALVALCHHFKTLGAKVVVRSMISRGNAALGHPPGGSNTGQTYDQLIHSVNALIRADYTSFADYFIDYEALDPTVFGATGGYANTTYYSSDQLHPTVAGYKRLATFDATAINTFVANLTGAPAGNYVSSSLAGASGVTLTAATSATIASINLPAGDWDVEGYAGIIPGASTSLTQFRAFIGTATSGFPDEALAVVTAPYVPGSNNISYAVPMQRFSLSSPTTINLVEYAQFSVSTLKGYGRLSARRIH